MKEILTKVLADSKISVNPREVEKLCEFYDMLIEWNGKFNLTRIVSEEDASIKHFADSLVGKDHVFGSVADVGSGGGFPSIPLAIVRKDLHFTLIEANGKKAGFLEAVTDKLQLTNCTVLKCRAEDLADCRESFDTVTARAVAELNTLLEYCLPLVKVGGKFIAYKGANYGEEVAKCDNALKLLGGSIGDTLEFDLAHGGGKRALVVVDKISSTPAKYPRPQGKPRTKPL